MLDALSLDQMELAFSLVSDWQVEKVVDPVPGEAPYFCSLYEPGTAAYRYGNGMVYHIAEPSTISGDEVEVECVKNPKKARRPAGSKGVAVNILYQSHPGLSKIEIQQDRDMSVQHFYYPKEFSRRFVFDTYEAEWEHDIPARQPANTFGLYPNIRTARGRLIIQQIMLDLVDILQGQPINYLALYNRNLLVEKQQIEAVVADEEMGADEKSEQIEESRSSGYEDL